MNKRIPNHLLRELSRRISGQMGLYFPEGRWLDLLRGVRSAAEEMGYEDVESFIQWLLQGPLKKQQIEVLARHLTVGETYFFREPKVFEALEKKILPELIRSRWATEKRLRIWSAGCCSGEEAYSIAILLSRMLPDLKQWNIRILATDINPFFLQKASDGIYREWSFRGTPYWLKENYFKTLDDGCYEIIPQVKRMVEFQYLNLVEDVYPSIYNDTNAMDIIFCRNVLMYFSQNQVKRIIRRFHHSLLDSAYLVVASSETSHLFYPKFITVNFPGAILYRKDREAVKDGQKFQNQCQDPLDYEEPQFAEPLSPEQITVPENEEKGTTFVEDYQSAEADKEAGEPLSEEALEACIQKAETHYDQGQYAQTIDVLQTGCQTQIDNIKVITLLAKSFANQGNLNDALIWCERALHSEKLNPMCHHLRAVILQEKGEIDEAITALQRALYLDPDFTLAYFMLGNLKRQNGRLEEANKYFKNALNLLEKCEKEDILPESEGMTVGRLTELIRLMINQGNPS